MILRTASFTALIFVLSGCATTSGLAPQTSHSGFDNARVVTIQAHGNACKSMVCTGLGAQWSAKHPDTAILNVQIFNEIKGITGAQLNIDGKVFDLKSTKTATVFDSSGGVKQSQQGFIAPLRLIEDITKSQKTWLRVLTTSGSYEDAVIDGTTDSKSFHALKRFLSAIAAPV